MTIKINYPTNSIFDIFGFQVEILKRADNNSYEFTYTPNSDCYIAIVFSYYGAMNYFFSALSINYEIFFTMSNVPGGLSTNPVIYVTPPLPLIKGKTYWLRFAFSDPTINTNVALRIYKMKGN